MAHDIPERHLVKRYSLTTLYDTTTRSYVDVVQLRTHVRDGANVTALNANSMEDITSALPRIGFGRYALAPQLVRQESLADSRPTDLALTKDIDDVLHRGIDGFESAIVSGEGLEQRLGWTVVGQQRTDGARLFRLLSNNRQAELDAFITDKDAGSRN